MKRLYKPGDRVQLRSGGPLMEVIKYVDKRGLFNSKSASNHRVLCVWYDKYDGRKEGVFHQNSLVKIKSPERFVPDKLALLGYANRQAF